MWQCIYPQRPCCMTVIIFLVFCCVRVIFGHQPLGSGVLLPANNRARSAQKTCRPAYIAVSVSSLPICHNEPRVCGSVWPWPGLSYAYTHTQSREANSGQGEACTSAVFTQNPVGCGELVWMAVQQSEMVVYLYECRCR